jgi:hypothetical protein
MTLQGSVAKEQAACECTLAHGQPFRAVACWSYPSPEKEFLVKNRPLVLIALVGLAGTGALSCASQSATTAGPSTEHQATPAPAPATEQQAAQPQAAAAPVVGPPQVAWADMTKPQRGKYMATVVMPRMGELFRSFDAKEFAEFGCKTCHGQDARERAFKMPNPGIYELPATPEGWGSLMKDKPEFMKFMNEKVKPEMATLLGLKQFEPQNPQPGTFGCNGCHTIKSP